MKKLLPFVLSIYSLCNAQTTVTKSFNDPVSGDNANYLTATGTPNNSGTGANITFNNSSLVLGSSAPGVYSTPSASEISTFPSSTLKLTGSPNTVYYKQSASKLEITGLITTDATLNLSANNGTFISYPAAYGYNETDQAQGTFTSTTANGLCKGTITLAADAWGTLLLASSSFTNVLRVKSVQNFNLYLPNDTSFVFPIGSIVNTSYSYYGSTYKFPLLTTNETVVNIPVAGINNQTTSSAQALSTIVLAAGDSSAKAKGLKIYPNPADDFINLKGDTENYATAKIYSLDGKLIKQSDLKSGKVPVSDLPPASYFIEVSGKNSKPEAAKFIKK
ncbi:T9SS type A sorting domain-containing protein [Chryseobacterium sp. PS-8]|uniref:T9SS type A sorting domain-containing protein n=1 Tax=Chryseobacterium indicum TaxID=2766954 RepID=A0ABS9C7C9_9FLAO|nr:T9SS type A sorting domain-containing protein [Chryseobacterium sp. PS-8]MCF2220458.1 T9SS type A sorting domain-containing protein [Chryseobacterium sp. PS-8]